MWIPGFGSDDIRPQRRSANTEAHKQRMAVIKKALKKILKLISIILLYNCTLKQMYV